MALDPAAVRAVVVILYALAWVAWAFAFRWQWQSIERAWEYKRGHHD